MDQIGGYLPLGINNLTLIRLCIFNRVNEFMGN